MCALIDYKIPVAVLKDSGMAAKSLELLENIFVSWKVNLLISDNVDNIIKYIDVSLSKK